MVSECVELLCEGPALKRSGRACFLSFGFVPLFWGETAALLRRSGLCFLSQHAYVFQVVHSCYVGLSPSLIPPSQGSRSEKNRAAVQSPSTLSGLLLLQLSQHRMWVELAESEPKGVSPFFLLPSHLLPPRSWMHLQAKRWGQGICQAFRIFSHNQSSPRPKGS